MTYFYITIVILIVLMVLLKESTLLWFIIAIVGFTFHLNLFHLFGQSTIACVIVPLKCYFVPCFVETQSDILNSVNCVDDEFGI